MTTKECEPRVLNGMTARNPIERAFRSKCQAMLFPLGLRAIDSEQEAWGRHRKLRIIGLNDVDSGPVIATLYADDVKPFVQGFTAAMDR